MFMLNILCDVIRDVVYEDVYVWQIWLIRQSDSFRNDRLQLLQRRVDILNDPAVGQFQKRSTSVTAAKGGHIEQHFD